MSPAPDRRPPAPGCARAVAKVLEDAGVEPARMRAWLRDELGVDRFADLTYSMADAVKTGLRKGILLDDIRRHPPRPGDTDDA